VIERAGEQRRREPRTVLQGRRGLIRGCFPATLLDISPGGVCFETHAAIRPGAAYELSADFGGTHVSVRVLVRRCAVCRTEPSASGGRALVYCAGAAFVDLEAGQLATLQGFLGRFEEGAVAVDAGLSEAAPSADFTPTGRRRRRKSQVQIQHWDTPQP